VRRTGLHPAAAPRQRVPHLRRLPRQPGHQIRGLLDSGIPTRIINLILPCLDTPGKIIVDDAEPELLKLLAEDRDRMTDRIHCLPRNRDASYLDAVNEATAQRRAGRRCLGGR
jgi:hypothetical protein